MSIYKTSKSFIIKQIKEDSVMLNGETGDYFGLNSVGTDFINLVDGIKSIDQIIDELIKMYDVPKDILTSDINELLCQLLDKNILVELE